MAGFVIADPPHEPADIPNDVLPLSHDASDFRDGARLCNFPTAKATIRSSHVGWVSDKVEPLFRQLRKCTIDLIGHASPRGGDTFNLGLSQRRLDAVQALLQDRADKSSTKVEFRKAQAKGETEAVGFGEKEESNSGAFRAVEVQVFGSRPPIVVRPGKLSRGVKLGAEKFKIRLMFAAGAQKAIEAAMKLAKLTRFAKLAIPVTAEVLMFEIREDEAPPAKNLNAFFVYVGGGFGLGASGGDIASLPSGPFTHFRTTRRIILPTFDGEATLGAPPSVTVGPQDSGPIGLPSIVQLTMESGKLMAARALVVPRHLRITTGPSLSVNLFSVTKGRLILLDASPFPSPE